MISRYVLKHCLDSSRHQMQKTLGLYLHTCSRVFKTYEGSITLFHSSIQKLKVPSISIVQCGLCSVVCEKYSILTIFLTSSSQWMESIPSVTRSPCNMKVSIPIWNFPKVFILHPNKLYKLHSFFLWKVTLLLKNIRTEMKWSSLATSQKVIPDRLEELGLRSNLDSWNDSDKNWAPFTFGNSRYAFARI